MSMKESLRRLVESTREYCSGCRVSAADIAVVVTVVLLVGSGVAVAQVELQEREFTDDFEDQNADGWEGENMQVVNQSVNGSWSLEGTDGLSSHEDNPEWSQGPVLDLSEEFTAGGVTYIGQGSGSRRVGLGIVRPATPTSGAEGVLLLFSAEHSATFIAQDVTEDPGGEETISNDFHDTWVRWELYSSGENGTMYAKVWEYGTSEPSAYQLQRDMEPDSGSFSMFLGTADNNRVMRMDDVTITGTEQTDPDLELLTPQLLLGGESQSYSVEYTSFDSDQGRNVTEDVTENATVESMDTGGLTVNQTSHELVATTNEEYADRVNVRAEYNGSVTYEYVTVIGDGEVTMEHLEILPPVYRITAFLGDWTVFLFILAMGAGIIGTRRASVFMGLSMAEMVIVVGWFGGYVSTGLAMTSVFAALFIGLNVAANIDYSVRR